MYNLTVTLFMCWFPRFVRCWSFIDNVILSWKQNVLGSILVGGEVTEPPEMYSMNCKMYHLNFGKCSSGKSNFTFLEWSSCLTDLDSAGATRAPCVAASRITRPHEDSAKVSCSIVFDTDDQYLEALKVSWFPGHYIVLQVNIVTIDMTE